MNWWNQPATKADYVCAAIVTVGSIGVIIALLEVLKP